MENYNWAEILDGEGAIIGFEKVPVENDIQREERLNTVKSRIVEDKALVVTTKAAFEAELAKFLADISASDARDEYAANMQSIIDRCSSDIASYDAAITKVEDEISSIYEEMEEIEPPAPPTPTPPIPTPDPIPDSGEGEEVESVGG